MVITENGSEITAQVLRNILDSADEEYTKDNYPNHEVEHIRTYRAR